MMLKSGLVATVGLTLATLLATTAHADPGKHRCWHSRYHHHCYPKPHPVRDNGYDRKGAQPTAVTTNGKMNARGNLMQGKDNGHDRGNAVHDKDNGHDRGNAAHVK
jgi:hypothetical protein